MSDNGVSVKDITVRPPSRDEGDESTSEARVRWKLNLSRIESGDVPLPAGEWAYYIHSLVWRTVQPYKPISPVIYFLLGQPLLRELQLRENQGFKVKQFIHLIQDDESKAEAAMAYCTGEVMLGDERCEACREGEGPFPNCVRFKNNNIMPDCACCHWGSNETRCQFYYQLVTNTQENEPATMPGQDLKELTKKLRTVIPHLEKIGGVFSRTQTAIFCIALGLMAPSAQQATEDTQILSGPLVGDNLLELKESAAQISSEREKSVLTVVEVLEGLDTVMRKVEKLEDENAEIVAKLEPESTQGKDSDVSMRSAISQNAY